MSSTFMEEVSSLENAAGQTEEHGGVSGAAVTECRLLPLNLQNRGAHMKEIKEKGAPPLPNCGCCYRLRRRALTAGN
ncbi:hypothetical protein PIB30_097571, partial [Stylosanthes scabra]|nr:hypothetical protein [Stylosanthes scabra]